MIATKLQHATYMAKRQNIEPSSHRIAVIGIAFFANVTAQPRAETGRRFSSNDDA
jgi:hypothetical protein